MGLIQNKLNEKDYKGLVDNASYLIQCVDSDGKFIYVNKTWKEKLGYADEDIDKLFLWDIIHSQSKEHCQKVFQQVISGGEIDAVEAVFQTKNGKALYVEGSANCRFDDAGNFVSTRGIFRDITDRKQMEEKLQESEKNFRVFFETMNDLIFVNDEQGKIVFINSAVTKILGYTLEELNNIHLLEVYPKSERKEAEQIFEEIFAGKRDTCPLPLATKSGRFLPVETRIWRGKWDGEDCIFSVSKDLSTEQEALQKFNRLFVSNPALMAVSMMPEGVITEVNDIFLEKIGYSRDEITGKTAEELNLFYFHKQEKKKEFAEELQKTGKVRDFELKIKTKNGQMLNGLYSGEIIESQGKEYFLAVIMDITKRKQAEEKIEYLSFHDDLTGLYNRRFIKEEIERLDTKRNLPFTIMVLDVNGLKLTNDAFGHEMGDRLLKKAADIMKKVCRADEIIGRVGGDEFAILLPETDEIKAKIIKKRIIDTAATTMLDSIVVSLAIGYAVKESADQDIKEIHIQAENRMYKDKLRYRKRVKSQTIESFINSINTKYDRERIHVERVSRYCEAMGKAMKFNEKEMNDIKTAALLHDIGKIIVPAELLNKNRKLSKKEFEVYKRHPEAGYQILKSVDEYAGLAEYVLYHHERWDGKGYPEGLKGEEIPLISRIISVADAYEVMTAQEAYQKTENKEKAIAELKNCAGSRFDPDVVKVFVSLWGQA